MRKGSATESAVTRVSWLCTHKHCITICLGAVKHALDPVLTMVPAFHPAAQGLQCNVILYKTIQAPPHIIWMAAQSIVKYLEWF